MPEFEIVVDGTVTNRRFADSADEALSEFLDGMQPHGVKRTGPTSALFLREVEIMARPALAEVVPMYASAGAMDAPGRERWRR